MFGLNIKAQSQNPFDNLRLAIKWNYYEIAKKYIFNSNIKLKVIII